MKLRASGTLLIAALVILLALPLTAFAQATQPATATAPITPKIAGTYTFSGASLDGSNPYTGTLTIAGSGAVYSFDYAVGDAKPTTSIAFLTRDLLVDVSGDPSCSNTVYARHSDGTLLGKWIDVATSNTLGLETDTPKAKTTDFGGSYTVIGANGDGSTYTGTLDVTAGDNGLYTFNYGYPASAAGPAYSIKGDGLANGNVIGVASSVNALPPEKCNLFLAQFQADGSYSATVLTAGKLATEKGSLKP